MELDPVSGIPLSDPNLSSLRKFSPCLFQFFLDFDVLGLGRQQWAITLSEYDLKFEPRTAIKGELLADFLVECHLVAVEGITTLHPVWALYVDGAESAKGSKARTVLIALRSFCDDYNIELAFTYVYTPQSNGQAELANKIVLCGLKTRVLAAHSNWVDELNKVLWSCRTTPSLTTGETPFSLAYGAETVILVEINLLPNRPAWLNDSNNEQLLRENLDLVEEVREISRMKNMTYQGRVAIFYNKQVRAHQF
ncbi:hypothetical protein SLEP1_g19005 [Rubroshorea leprosula]|nr:hypothetical protein SLEP1_g19005 [Rubroshorea leprosula]